MFDRILSFDADVRAIGQDDVSEIRVDNLPFVWNPDEASMDTAAYWAAVQWLDDRKSFDWFSVKSWATSPVKEGA